ncbi:hypothetical protein DIE04_02430 [Burkholderia sp. Bp8994]|nr:hypothetical protein DIE20_11280 [Burkholderia sp. Bp9131]RQR74327.1 hypothetical protein DIE12_12555 [Burkholderia sp. Bp9015]RQR80831.1 hypothetical protein DIE10_19375 [Burkholderia sp. Bp9011]RQR88674.1 hypothetical protein DIE09_25615 [Burkholderia sp. Bp9010]RQS01212.1 hypothetical protein DIE04_02430 [Burkholderia sp. Bp8994]RQS04008.1 hypothetical protein DIE02_19610 [Burkholderia sp. Bp8991]RQS28202.1 hypothetical protein DIE05_16640 [Burkholderia sp. Bp8995]RQS38824.1 hypothetic
MMVLPCQVRMPARGAAARSRTRHDGRHRAVLYRADASFNVKRMACGLAEREPRQENCVGQAFRRQAAHATECCNCPRWFLKEEWAAF